MSKLRVKPNGNGWSVTKNGVTKSNHRKKNRAVKKAKKMASAGDMLTIQRANGTIQETRRY